MALNLEEKKLLETLLIRGVLYSDAGTAMLNARVSSSSVSWLRREMESGSMTDGRCGLGDTSSAAATFLEKKDSTGGSTNTGPGGPFGTAVCEPATDAGDRTVDVPPASEATVLGTAWACCEPSRKTGGPRF
jgi:hypothetical protein